MAAAAPLLVQRIWPIYDNGAVRTTPLYNGRSWVASTAGDVLQRPCLGARPAAELDRKPRHRRIPDIASASPGTKAAE
jgi:hypothetical protein